MEIRKIGSFWYCFKDGPSTIKISHKECTECLDAWVESGDLFLPYALKTQLLEIEETKGRGLLPNGRDLYLVNANNESIEAELFGNQENYLTKWENQYEVTGIVTAIKGHGLVFQVETYEQINTTQ